jgi:hypothetical protein
MPHKKVRYTLVGTGEAAQTCVVSRLFNLRIL